MVPASASIRLMTVLMNWLPDLTVWWRHLDQYFKLFASFCALGEAERVWCYERKLIEVFADFYMNDGAARAANNHRPRAHRVTMGDKTQPPPFHHLLKAVSLVGRQCLSRAKVSVWSGFVWYSLSGVVL